MGIKQQLFISIWSMLLISITSLSGQPLKKNNYIPNIQRFTTLDGLSHRSVSCVFQDRDDVIWLGTQNGLNRFDGYRFKHWLGKNHGVDLRYIYGITQDDAGWLWITTGLENKDIIFFHPKTEVFQTIVERFGEDCILLDIDFADNHTEQNFVTDKHGTIFFHKMRSNKVTLCSYHSSTGFLKIRIPSILQDKEYWINHISEEGDFFIEYADSNSSSDKVKTVVLSLYKNALVFIRYENKIKRYANGKVNYKNGQNWNINKENAIMSVYDVRQNLIISLDNDPINNFRGVYFDKKNRAWVYTSFGIHLIELRKNKFSFFENTEHDDNRSQSTRGIIANSTEMMVAFAFNNVGKYHFKLKQWSYIKTNYHLISMYASAGGLWIGGSQNISLWKNEQLATYPMFFYEDDIEISQNIWCIFPSNLSSKKLWLGAEMGLFLFDTETKKSQLITNPLMKSGYRIQTIVRDTQNENWLWLCSNKGLILFDEAKEQFLNIYNINQSKKQFLPTDNIQHLHQDEEGIYWLATVDGVIRWDQVKNEYRQLTVANGLPDNVVYAMYPDDYGNLWMSSDYGIIRMNKTTFAIKNYLLDDGIGQKEFNRVSHFSYRDENGMQRLFFGGLDGVTAFYPKDFQTDKQEIKPTLAILKYQQFDGDQKSIVDRTTILIANNKIIIQPNDYIHLLEVGLLNYNNVDNNQYRYQIKINGKLSDWITQQSRFIQVGQLPFGTHQLIITGNTLNNISAKNDLTIDIIIRRPFYLTWWFMLIVMATIAGSIFYYFNNKNSRLKAKQIELEGLVKERTEKIEADKTIIEKQATKLREIDGIKSRFFANISHELRTPITLIQGPIQFVLNSQDLTNRNFTLLTKAKQHTGKLLELVNEILDLTKLDAHKMVVDETTIVFYTFLRSIISNFESIADIQVTNLSFIYDLPQSLKIKADKNKLEKILNNLLSNAFKFTPKNGKIIVHIQALGNTIQMTVKDNGRGVPTQDVPNIFNRFFQSSVNTKAEGGLGIGLALSMEFVKLLDGKMWVESQIDEIDTGSTFYVQFPKREVTTMITTEAHEVINQENDLMMIPILINENRLNNPVSETILIVEDNHDLREYLTYILSPFYNIITAENGQEALEALLIANHQGYGIGCQLILSDVMMPIMDGFEFLERVKANEQWQGLPFIMLTARAEMETRLNALRIGVDDYLLKPFDEEELLVKVQNLLVNQRERIAAARTISEDTTETSKEVIVLKTNQEWLVALEQLIFEEMNNPIFSVDFLAEILSMTRKTLHNKIKHLSGLTPIRYIRAIRLQRAKSLLEKGVTVSAVAQQVGFQSPEYFSTLFKESFGKSPSYYRDEVMRNK